MFYLLFELQLRTYVFSTCHTVFFWYLLFLSCSKVHLRYRCSLIYTLSVAMLPSWKPACEILIFFVCANSFSYECSISSRSFSWTNTHTYVCDKCFLDVSGTWMLLCDLFVDDSELISPWAWPRRVSSAHRGADITEASSCRLLLWILSPKWSLWSPGWIKHGVLGKVITRGCTVHTGTHWESAHKSPRGLFCTELF